MVDDELLKSMRPMAYTQAARISRRVKPHSENSWLRYAVTITEATTPIALETQTSLSIYPRFDILPIRSSIPAWPQQAL